MPNVLMIAFHYPPVGESSGVHRTLKFSQYLPQNGWQPSILTVNPRAYERVNNYQLKDIPESVEVNRAFALDTARHLSVFGRYPGFLALPDRWISWWVGGVLSGLRMIRKQKPRVIMSTYPIATAHLIGLTLHRITGVPWVLDFRDSMTEDDYPIDPVKRRVFQWIERHAIKYCAKAIFTTPGALRMYKERYPDLPASRWAVIENGYDEEKFTEIEAAIKNSSEEKTSEKIVLVHSGLLYASERNPIPFFESVAVLKQQGIIAANSIEIVLRASGNEAEYSSKLNELNINDIVTLAPPVNYGEALKEMLESDGLLLFQGSSCNHQIPAKVYEYIRARKPVFAMTDLKGNTAEVLEQAGISSIVSLDSKLEIKAGLQKFLTSIKEGNAEIASELSVEQHARRRKSEDLAKLLNEVAK